MARLRLIPEHFLFIVPKATEHQPKIREVGTKALSVKHFL